MPYKMSQDDYDTRKQRQNDGVASDDDRRHIKIYEEQGYTQSRLKRDERAKQAAAAAREGLSAEELAEAENAGENGPELPKITQRDRHEDWITFANKINEQLAPDERPVAEPEKATKTALMAAYRHFATATE